MQEYELEVLEQYPVEVKSTQKTRGAFFCDTDQGLLLFREAKMSEKRAEAMMQLMEGLIENGFLNVDVLLKNKEGKYITESQEGTGYMLKQWFSGRECDMRKKQDLIEGVKNLARFHLAARQINPVQTFEKPDLEEIYRRRLVELKKIRQFVRKLSVKKEFEKEFLQAFGENYEWALAAVQGLSSFGYREYRKKCLEQGQIIHGDYNYHNLLVEEKGMATTNFDRFCANSQLEDLYYYLRKVLEKHHWNPKMAHCLLNAYSAIQPIGKAEMEYMKWRFVFPEKYWKIADYYCQSNKAMVYDRTIEKLKTAACQREEKNRFLEALFSFSI